VEQQSRNDVSSRRVAANADLAFGNAKDVDEVMIGGESFDELRGVDVFWGERVVEEEDREPGAAVDKFGEEKVER
jgi:hypothetical protein